MLSRRAWRTRFDVVALDDDEVVLAITESHGVVQVVDPPWVQAVLDGIQRALGGRTPELMVHARCGAGMLGPVEEQLWIERMQSAVEDGLAIARAVPEVAEHYATLVQRLSEPTALIDGVLRAPRLLLAWTQPEGERVRRRSRTWLDTAFGRVGAVARMTEEAGETSSGVSRQVRQYIEPDAEGRRTLDALGAQHGLLEGVTARAWLDIGLSEDQGWPVLLMRREEHATPQGLRRAGLSMRWDGLPPVG